MAKRKVGRRNLRHHGVEVASWRESVDGRAPRLTPTEYIGTGVTRTGRFASRDPLRTGKVWTRWHWLGFLGWAGWLGGLLAVARRRAGSPD